MFRIVPQLTVADIARSAEFYTARLGFAVVLRDPPDAPDFVTLERDDATVFLVTADSREEPDTVKDLATNKAGVGVRLYFEVDDARQLHEQAVQAGVQIRRDLTYNPDENYTEFVLLDPDGYEVGIYS